MVIVHVRLDLIMTQTTIENTSDRAFVYVDLVNTPFTYSENLLKLFKYIVINTWTIYVL